MRIKINLLPALLLLSAVTTMAQELKRFTLEDLIPGGSNFYNCSTKNLYDVQWWGDRCIVPDAEEVKAVNPRSGRESLLFNLVDVNEGILSYTGAKLPRVHSLYGVRFPDARQPIVMLRFPEHIVYYNFSIRQVDHLIGIDRAAANADIAPGGRAVAYTLGDRLLIRRTGENKPIDLSPEFADPAHAPKPHDIVYGQAVHRNEFGITKGTFWSPRGSRLAYYRMDQSMVTDYPQVNIDTRIATLELTSTPWQG